MKYRDEFRIASTAILLSVAMFGISVVVPKESRVPTAKTTLVEAPETAAEAEAAANEKINASLNDKVLRYQQIQKWDGKYPNVVSDSASVLMNLPSDDADSSSTETPTNP